MTFVEWASAISERPDLAEAVAEAGEHLHGPGSALGGPPDLLLAFVSGHALGDGVQLSHHLQKIGGVVLGGSAGGVIGGGREVERRPALALMAARLPGVQVLPFHAAGEVDLDVSPEQQPAFLVLPDPFTCAVESLLGAMDAAWPSSVKLGALVSGGRAPGQNVLLVGDTVHTRGAVGVALVGDIRIDPLVAQGCRPIGRPLRVTRCRAHMLLELDGRPAVTALDEMWSVLSEEDRERFRASPLVGIAVEEDACRSDFLVRNLLGLDRRAGVIGVGWAPDEGALVQFHLRDAASSAGDLEERLARQTPPEAALLFTCVGRGEDFHGRSGHDSDILRRRLGPVPIGGFFGSGEIGPVHGRSHVHGYTSAIGLVRRRGWD